MNRSEILNALADLGWVSNPSWIPEHLDYVSVSCPYAKWIHRSGKDEHPSMSIRIVPGKEYTYQCFTCRETGTLWDLKH